MLYRSFILACLLAFLATSVTALPTPLGRRGNSGSALSPSDDALDHYKVNDVEYAYVGQKIPGGLGRVNRVELPTSGPKKTSAAISGKSGQISDYATAESLDLDAPTLPTKKPGFFGRVRNWFGRKMPRIFGKKKAKPA